ncbi:MAG: SPOR domain-containing protein [Pseudomonadota bacterium]
MAYVHEADGLDQDQYGDEQFETSINTSNTLTSIGYLAGGLMSLALIAGLGVWGYKLVQRDVTGLPVVRAAAGEMRIRPTDPGGQLASNQGLAVNAIAAQGTTEEPAETLVLAPPPPDLAEVKVPEQAQEPQTAAPVQQPEPLDVAAALETGDIDRLVARLTDNATPLVETAPALVKREPARQPLITETVEPVGTPGVADAQPEIIAASVPGTAWSKRPTLRPASLPVTAPVETPVAPTTPPAAAELSPSDIPAGTRLVQLGAYDSAETARKEWDRFNAQFGEYMVGKDRVVQRATSGGRTFYRLRAHGFTDISDARRFCAVLVARNADCIPVVTR